MNTSTTPAAATETTNAPKMIRTGFFPSSQALLPYDAAKIADAEAKFAAVVAESALTQLLERIVMGTTRDDICRWFDAAKKSGATHMIVVCDTYDHEDYPVNIMSEDDVKAKYEYYNGKNMQRVMEVYAMHLDRETQLNERYAMHLESAPK